MHKTSADQTILYCELADIPSIKQEFNSFCARSFFYFLLSTLCRQVVSEEQIYVYINGTNGQ
jgi:hypothetical protein